MITILPMQDGDRKRELLSAYPTLSGRMDVIVMAEKEEEFGTAVLCVDGSVVRILSITVNGQEPESYDMMGKMVADSLLRSAASYGETNGAERIEAYLPKLERFLETKGFVKTDTCMATPMSTIVHRKNPQK